MEPGRIEEGRALAHEIVMPIQLVAIRFCFFSSALIL
jgi:hypothetical protein